MIDSGVIFERVLAKLADEDRKVVEAFASRLTDEISSVVSAHGENKSLSEAEPLDRIAGKHELKKTHSVKDGFHLVLKSNEVMSGGAPAPQFFATENDLAIFFFLEEGETACFDTGALFKISNLQGFELASNVGGYDHKCVFEPYGYSDVWQRKSDARDEVELVFGFHDTSFYCRCTKFEYLVIHQDKVWDEMQHFLYS